MCIASLSHSLPFTLQPDQIIISLWSEQRIIVGIVRLRRFHSQTKIFRFGFDTHTHTHLDRHASMELKRKRYVITNETILCVPCIWCTAIIAEQ